MYKKYYLLLLSIFLYGVLDFDSASRPPPAPAPAPVASSSRTICSHATYSYIARTQLAHTQFPHT